MHVPLGFLLSVWGSASNPPSLHKIQSLVIFLNHFQSLLSALTDSIYRAVTSEKMFIFQLHLDISWNSRTLKGRHSVKCYLSRPPFWMLRSWKLKSLVLGQIVVEQRVMLINHILLYFQAIYVGCKYSLIGENEVSFWIVCHL